MTYSVSKNAEKKLKSPFANYVCYNKLRTGHKGGGVCIGFARNLMGGIKTYDSKSRHDILTVTLDSTFFGLRVRRNVILITCHIPPSNSSFLNKIQFEPFEQLLELLAEVENKYDIILCGDFNSRTKTTMDISLCNSIPGTEDIDL